MSWKTLKSKEILRVGLFRLRKDECELPDGRVMPGYYVIEFGDWVNVVPVTASGQVVMVNQYRQARGEFFLEIPGGSTDTKDASPEAAARRELLEETGYSSAEWESCGFHCPNPALQNNRLHTFIAWNCEYIRPPKLDPFEDLSVRLLPIAKVFDLLDSGEIQHSLIATSLNLSRRIFEQRGYF